MKNIFNKIILPVALSIASFMCSCTKDYGEINTNPLKPQEKHLERDGLLSSSYIPTLLFTCYIPTAIDGTGAANNYQVSFNLTEDSWVGYLAPRDAKWPNRNLSQFFFDTGWTNGTFSNLTQAIMSPWIHTKKVAKDVENPNMELWSIAQISKIMGMHRATDMFGAIPYKKIGSGAFNVPYDSQEEIYKSFFDELEEAVDILYKYSAGGKKIYGTDYVYCGDAAKWAKLGNSLMLRLALRVRFVDPELSKKWVAKAVESPAGLILSLEDMAMIDRSNGVQTKNSLYVVSESYNDTRMGASICCYMRGYSDPRMKVYFKGDLDFSVPPAIPQTGEAYNKAAKPLVKEFDATVWFRPSETNFLLAEAALIGHSLGKTPKEYYEEGIMMSFKERGIDDEKFNAYINNTSTPSSFVDKANLGYSAPAPSNVTIPWYDADGEEKNLERIITQKYIAIFPDGMEAWSEWRRTGYPHLVAPNTSISNAGVIPGNGFKDGVRSWPYPENELQLNTDNVNEAISKYKHGYNGGNINVWWDTKSKQ